MRTSVTAATRSVDSLVSGSPSVSRRKVRSTVLGKSSPFPNTFHRSDTRVRDGNDGRSEPFVSFVRVTVGFCGEEGVRGERERYG